MSTPLMNTANQVLNALNEGKVQGVVASAEHFGIDIETHLRDVLTEEYIHPEELEYWIDWLGLSSTSQQHDRCQG